MKSLTAICLTGGLICCIGIVPLSAQNVERLVDEEMGEVEIGIRSTLSVFDEEFNPGLGYGGQLRFRAGKRIQTEWYADFIKTDVPNFGHRETVHVGWSVLLYPFNTISVKSSAVPYLLAGHCFDYAKLEENHFPSTAERHEHNYVNEERLSSAVQMGMGSHFYLADNFNLSVSAQYMYHIGNELTLRSGEKGLDSGHDHLFGNKPNVLLEGHVLVTASLNFYITDLVRR
ncbi:MAG: hypothetical protein ACI9RU_001122 [Litorivivens sp.]|jgi:hypothetical protein